jgi:hypothetical protein
MGQRGVVARAARGVAMSQGPQSGVRVRKRVRNAEVEIGRVRREDPFG